MRFLFLLISCLPLAGCGCTNGEIRDRHTPPFEGLWRKYDDPQVRFVKFQNGQIVIGDKEVSQSGSFSFAISGEGEPLYKVTANLPNRVEEFQLYYEEDTVYLTFDDEAKGGLYEITYNAPL